MWYYPLGLCCTAIIDPAFDISAYSFAAQSIISPMAGMVVVWNVLLAPYTLGETLTRSRKLGALLIVLGTLFVGLFGNHNSVDRTVEEYLVLFSRPLALLYYFVFACISVVMGWYMRHGSPFVAGFCGGGLGGLLAGNMFTTKAVVEMLKCVATADDPEAAGCAYNPFLTVFPYLFIAISLTLACVSLYLLAVGLKNFEALYMITVFEGFMIISGSISGNIVMNEKEGQPTLNLVIYTGAIGIILVGLHELLKGERGGEASLLGDAGIAPASEGMTEMGELHHGTTTRLRVASDAISEEASCEEAQPPSAAAAAGGGGRARGGGRPGGASPDGPGAPSPASSNE